VAENFRQRERGYRHAMVMGSDCKRKKSWLNSRSAGGLRESTLDGSHQSEKNTVRTEGHNAGKCKRSRGNEIESRLGDYTSYSEAGKGKSKKEENLRGQGPISRDMVGDGRKMGGQSQKRNVGHFARLNKQV